VSLTVKLGLYTTAQPITAAEFFLNEQRRRLPAWKFLRRALSGLGLCLLLRRVFDVGKIQNAAVADVNLLATGEARYQEMPGDNTVTEIP